MSYFMVGTLGVLTASGAKSAVSDILSNMAASADVLALAKIEVEMGSIPEGECGVFFFLSVVSRPLQSVGPGNDARDRLLTRGRR